METTPLLIYGMFFLAIALATLAIADWAQERQSLRRTLKGVETTTGPSGLAARPRDEQLSVPVVGRVLIPTLERFGRIARRLSPRETYERIEKDLVLAGSPANWDTERVFAWKLVLPFVAGGGMLLLILTLDDPGLLLMLAAPVIFAAAAWYAPEWIVRSRAGKRQHEIQLTLADAIDLLSITVEAGLAFDAALARVAQNVKGPLGQELYRVVQEIQLGKARSDALRALSDRTDVEDLKSFIAAMVQAEAFGLPIARVLKVQAREIRIRRRQRAEEQAQKLPVKIVFPVVLTIFPALFVVLLGPAAIQIYEVLILGL